ncbi:GntR family transcriptional regulator [Phaeovulum sp. W22_SRMD_FR3]|uniref:GntR family transcriptional regulator n=1 Tax=Phaeovulum sp. W22_SRMD_FR3 TaxID=3240274 RepID=UPI003F968F8B
MTLKRISPPPSLAHLVAGQVREAIITGVLPLGENISEDRLVAQFGVSRTPIRDAMAILSNEGLVVVRPKRGSFVFETSLEDILQICDYRIVLETQAVRRAVQVARADFLAAMQEVLGLMDRAFAAEDHTRYDLLDTDFHRLAFDHCANSYLRDAYTLVAGRIAALRANLTAAHHERRVLSRQEHHQMHGHLSTGDFTAFDEMIGAHVRRTGDAYILALAEGKLGASAP